MSLAATSMRLASPLALALLALLPALFWWRRRRRRPARLKWPDLGLLEAAGQGWRPRLAGLPAILRGAALVLLVLALARPQQEDRSQEILSEGVDIVLAVDNSGSMAAVDLGRRPGGFDPISRLDVARKVVSGFVKGRQADRIGLISFAGRAFTLCPLTLDYGLIVQVLETVEITRRYDGTAIGMGLATAVNRLKDSPAKSRVVILLTDGRNNTGEIDPETAAGLARTLGVRVYTVGVGSEGVAPVPVDDPVFGRRYVFQPVDIDEKTLRRIADVTQGRYFRATDADTLQEIFNRIDSLEKTEIKVKEHVRRAELFSWPAGIAACALLLEALLSSTWLRVEP